VLFLLKTHHFYATKAPFLFFFLSLSSVNVKNIAPVKHFILSLLLLLCAAALGAQDFDRHFDDATLRLDYILAGDTRGTDIYFSDMRRQPFWAGRRNRLSEQFLRGNGQLTVRDAGSGTVIYVTTFSTLYHEWLQSEEARTVRRAFETSYNVPFPKRPVDITLTLTDTQGRTTASMTHRVDPTDILIRSVARARHPFHYIWKGRCQKALAPTPERDRDSISGGTGRDYTQIPFSPFEGVDIAHNVDLAIVAEGYTEAETGKFYSDCRRAVDVLFAREPFRSLKPRFNVVAVAPPSRDSGVSVPHLRDWREGTSGARYDMFYIDRYFVTQEMHRVFDLLDGVPFEHIMILANTATYGGGGIYNQVTTSTSDHPSFAQVFVHEFGHSYAGLGDEYAYDDMPTVWYPKGTEPWEPNLTTQSRFSDKWQDLIEAGVPGVGLFEGAGYQSKGCWRPCEDCRMRTNAAPDFCPVCSRAIRRITDFYTAE